MAWRIEFDGYALKDLHALDRQVGRRITRFLRERLAQMDDPRGLAAAPLWRCRVGDWRIVVRIEDVVKSILAGKVAQVSIVWLGEDAFRTWAVRSQELRGMRSAGLLRR